MSFALGAGEIDLSVGSSVALSLLVAADLVGDYGFFIGATGAVLVAMVLGLVNGLITVKMRIPSFLVTLGMLATGAHRDAANSVGINTARVRISALVVSATELPASLGCLLAGRLAIGRHDLGENDLLTVIAAVVIGGTSLFGGRASVTGAVTGALIMAMLNNGLILMGLEVADQLIARGVIIILAVAVSMREQRES